MSGHLDKQDIQLVLDAWQKEMQAVSEQIEKLFRLFNYHGGALPDSIDYLQEGYTRLLADHIGFDFENNSARIYEKSAKICFILYFKVL